MLPSANSSLQSGLQLVNKFTLVAVGQETSTAEFGVQQVLIAIIVQNDLKATSLSRHCLHLHWNSRCSLLDYLLCEQRFASVAS